VNDVLANKDPVEDRKSLKVSHSFIKRQNSSKKMAKNKITKTENEPPPPPLSGITATNAIHKREHSSSAVRSVSRKDVTDATFLPPIPASTSDVKLPPLSAITENIKGGETEKPASTTPRHPETNSLRLPRLSLSTKPTNSDDSNINNKSLPLTARFEKVLQQSTIGPSPTHKVLQRTATVSCPTSSPKWNDVNNENAVPNYSSHPPSNPPPAPPGLNLLPTLDAKEVKELKDVLLTPKGTKMSLNEVVQKLNDLEMRVTVKEKFAVTEQTDLKRQMEDMKSSLDTLVSVINHLSVKFVPT